MHKMRRQIAIGQRPFVLQSGAQIDIRVSDQANSCRMPRLHFIQAPCDQRRADPLPLKRRPDCDGAKSVPIGLPIRDPCRRKRHMADNITIGLRHQRQGQIAVASQIADRLRLRPVAERHWREGGIGQVVDGVMV